jgi:hypothetical protein
MDANIGTNIVPNIRYITKYVKEHYVQKKIRRDLYERLIKWCGGDGINACLEKALSVLESNIGTNIVANICENIVPNIGTNTGDSRSSSMPNTMRHVAQSGVKSRKSAFEIFMERGYAFFSDLARSKNIKNPERVYESIKRNALASGIRVVECDLEADRVLLRADVWDAFKKKLGAVKTPDDKAVLDALKEEWEKRLYTLLARSGAVYFDAKAKDWVFDTGTVREITKESEEYVEDLEAD